MKKILLVLAALVLVIGGGVTWYNSEYGGKDYYIQVKKDGKEFSEKTHNGKTWHAYGYNEKGVDKAGQEKDLEFTAQHNLRHDAYLKITWNHKNGVTSWEEVQKKDVPEKSLDKI
jgi:conserved hypothetical protein TIGR01655